MTTIEIELLMQKLLDLTYSRCATRSLTQYNTIKEIIPDVAEGKIPLKNWLELVAKLSTIDTKGDSIREQFRDQLGKN